jgi:hypothetical protein
MTSHILKLGSDETFFQIRNSFGNDMQAAVIFAHASMGGSIQKTDFGKSIQNPPLAKLPQLACHVPPW